MFNLENFVRFLGHPEWFKDERFQENNSRTAHRKELIDLISAETRKETVDHWIKELNAVGVPCGKINTIEEALKHPKSSHVE